MKKFKKAKCKFCKKEFQKFRSTMAVCSLECSIELSNKISKEKKNREWKSKKSEMKESIKTLQDYVKETQAVFNKFIRLRDKNKPCISCGKNTATKWDAGHFYNANNHWFLRFNEDNVHKQCSRPCNKDLSGNLIEYRFRLIGKIGNERVDYLDSARHKTANFTKEYMIKLKELYKQKIKDYE